MNVLLAIGVIALARPVLVAAFGSPSSSSRSAFLTRSSKNNDRDFRPEFEICRFKGKKGGTECSFALSSTPFDDDDDDDGFEGMSYLPPSEEDANKILVSDLDDYDDDEQNDGDMGSNHIPSTGVSIADEMVEAQLDRYTCELEPYEFLSGVAEISTKSTFAGFQPLRYIVALSPPETNVAQKFVMVDIPPYSDVLLQKIRTFIGADGILESILVTNKNGIHYDQASAVYITRKSDMEKWAEAFPGLNIVMYRLDIARDCRATVTQTLDGNGPWALEDESESKPFDFVETGRPLTYIDWDEDMKERVIIKGESPPEDEEPFLGNEEMYTPEAIRKKEEGKRIIALYTPGYTFGSMTYIFPDMDICCSGNTVPIESTRNDSNEGIGAAGPAMDYRGYVTTSEAIGLQMKSAREVVETYGDRFKTVLPSKGNIQYMGYLTTEERKGALLDVIDQFDEIGKAYSQVGTADPY